MDTLSLTHYSRAMNVLTAANWNRATRLLPAVLSALAMLTALATYFVLTDIKETLGPDPHRVWQLLLINIVLIGGLIVMLGNRIWRIWKVYKRQAVSSRLQRRVAAMFGLITIVPTVVVTVFSVFFFNFGIQAWFNDRVGTAVEESLAVAEAYLAEHTENIRGDAMSMAADLDRFIGLALSDPIEFNRIVSAQAGMRMLSEVIVFHKNRIIAQGRLSFSLAFESMPQDALVRAEDGDVVLLKPSDDKIRALIKLDGLQDTYLLVGRLVDSKVLQHMESAQGAVNEYRMLKAQLYRLQVTFSSLFALFSILLLLAAVRFGLAFAQRIAQPLMSLVGAAERVRSGDYSVRVEEGEEGDEIATLARAFNRMAGQLEAQRGELVAANRTLDERRRFTETVLAGVSAGVIALDAETRVTLYNRPALAMLGDVLKPGMKIAELLPDIHEMIKEVQEKPQEAAQATHDYREGGKALTLHVRVSVEFDGMHMGGYVVTLDDITPLVSAQRHAAWSDVARRVAHEIKNPLTPIALAAERLKRKYAKLVEGEEAEAFVKYTDTIARHVADIGSMVEEFVQFARMPDPIFKRMDVSGLLRKCVFSEQVAHPQIEYVLNAPDTAIEFDGDEQQLSRAFSNLLKNAAEAIEGLAEKDESIKGKITADISCTSDTLRIVIRDNGPGFPPGQMQKMLEAYVTTRLKGTGLGLAITRKIIEDHKGKLDLANNPEGGAYVTLSFQTQCDINASNQLAVDS